METSAWLWKTACVNVSYELNLRTGKEWSINHSCWFNEQDQEIHWKDYSQNNGSLINNLNFGCVIASDGLIFVFFAHKKKLSASEGLNYSHSFKMSTSFQQRSKV